MKNKVVYQLKDKAIWVVFLVLVIAFTIANPRFINPSNIFSLLRQVSMFGIASIGMTFVILLGDIDLATGSIMSFVNIICAYMMVHMGVNMWLAILLTLIAATLIGVLNGFMVSTIGIPALIATFATQTAFAGLAYIVSGGLPINGFTDRFRIIGQGYISVVPVPVIIMAVCFAVGSFILNKTYFGRYFYAVGGNMEAAKLSGIDVKKYRYLAGMITAVFIAIGGILVASRGSSAQVMCCDNYLMPSLAAVLVGRTVGGAEKPNALGTMIGAMLVSTLENGLTICAVPFYVLPAVKGSVLALALIAAYASKKED